MNFNHTNYYEPISDQQKEDNLPSLILSLNGSSNRYEGRDTKRGVNKKSNQKKKYEQSCSLRSSGVIRVKEKHTKALKRSIKSSRNIKDSKLNENNDIYKEGSINHQGVESFFTKKNVYVEYITPFDLKRLNLKNISSSERTPNTNNYRENTSSNKIVDIHFPELYYNKSNISLYKHLDIENELCNYDIILLFLEQLIELYSNELLMKNKEKHHNVDSVKNINNNDNNKSIVFFKAFRDIITLTHLVSKKINTLANSKEFWMTMHFGCFNKRHLLGSRFKNLSFKQEYIEKISTLNAPELKQNLLSMVLGETTKLKENHNLAIELARRNSLQFNQIYIPVVFYTMPNNSEDILIRIATKTDTPNTVQYILKDHYDLLNSIRTELSTKLKLDNYYSSKATMLLSTSSTTSSPMEIQEI